MSLITAADILKNSGDVKRTLDEKRRQARDVLEETGSLPEWWEAGISIIRHAGAPRKFASPDEFFSLGFEYFETCAKGNRRPTMSGLILFMGFTCAAHFHSYPRRNIEFREAHARLLTMLKLPLELSLEEPGGQSGKMFLLKNLPDGMQTEDEINKPLNYPFKDRQTTELTGADGGAIEISRKIDPEDAYMQMLEGGVLEDEKETEPESEVPA